MDENTINAIADKLGIAVENVGEFIQTYLPSYAGTHIVNATFGIVIASFLLIASLTFMLVAINRYKYWNNKYYELGNAYGSNERRIASRNDDFWIGARLFGITAFLIFLAIFVIVISICIPDLINWSFYPEANLIHEILR